MTTHYATDMMICSEYSPFIDDLTFIKPYHSIRLLHMLYVSLVPEFKTNVFREPSEKDVQKCTHQERSLNIQHQCDNHGGFHFLELLSNLTSGTTKSTAAARRHIGGLMVRIAWQYSFVMCL